MSIPALLLFIFAPVLGLLFAPVLSAPVRVRVVAVLSALIVAASLSVSAPARASWEAKCESDAWDDTPSCRASILFYGKLENDGLSHNWLAYFCDGAGTQTVSLSKPRSLPFHEPVPIAGFATAEGRWNSGGKFRLLKFQIRWDKESPVDGVFLQPSESDVNDHYSDEFKYYWQWGQPSDWWGWKSLGLTPVSSNPIRLLQTKSQLRIRAAREESENPVVLTYSLEGAAEAIAEAKKGCGL